MKMKRLIFALPLAALLFASCSKREVAHYQVMVDAFRENCPVVITDLPEWANGVRVYHNGEEIPSQLDKALGEAAFVADIAVSEEFKVVFTEQPNTTPYESRVNAQMWWKNEDGTLSERDTLFSYKDDMYRKLHHHGPAIESEKAAYRVYFDKKQTIDTYGKKQPQLELRRSMWYSTDEQLAAGFGHDNLRVFGSIGVGVLKGWDPEKGMTHITDFKRREARVVAKGPVRAIMEMEVEGWNYCGRELSMISRYIIYAGHSDVQVENRIKGDFEGLTFVTGVMKMAGTFARRDDRTVAQIGCDHPENNYEKWPKEVVALAVSLPEDVQILSAEDDKLSYLYQVTPDKSGHIDYVFDMAWRKSNWFDEYTDIDLVDALFESTKKAAGPIRVTRIK